jgi:hypothetical protein
MSLLTSSLSRSLFFSPPPSPSLNIFSPFSLSLDRNLLGPLRRIVWAAILEAGKSGGRRNLDSRGRENFGGLCSGL